MAYSTLEKWCVITAEYFGWINDFDESLVKSYLLKSKQKQISTSVKSENQKIRLAKPPLASQSLDSSSKIFSYVMEILKATSAQIRKTSAKINMLKESDSQLAQEIKLLKEEQKLLEEKVVLQTLRLNKLMGLIDTKVDSIVEHMEQFLKVTAGNLNLTSKDRIQIFIKSGEHFYLTAAYSPNPVFLSKAISKVSADDLAFNTTWQDGVFIDQICPDYYADPVAYVHYLETTYKLPCQKTELLAMKGCRYYMRTISRANDTLGLVVCDSESPSFIDDDEKVHKIEECLRTFEEYLSNILHEYTNRKRFKIDLLEQKKRVNE